MHAIQYLMENDYFGTTRVAVGKRDAIFASRSLSLLQLRTTSIRINNACTL